MIGLASDFRRRLLRWYDAHRRDLPWRVNPGSPTGSFPDPYHVLISEAMLQQTQVATVIPYFLAFTRRFPSVQSLAEAELQDILRLWQGLGYYSRARNLHRCAQAIVAEHSGLVPDHVEALLALPGIGRYTAGAIASLAYDRRAPILDGNVMRVLARLDRITRDPRSTQGQQSLWRRAEELLPPRRRAGDFNSALMELGATVCTPRNPQCRICPVRGHCEAAEAGVQEQIPPPRKAVPSPLLNRCVLCITDGEGRYLIEQRPPTGRWAGMWQFVTLDLEGKTPSPAAVKARLGVSVRKLRQIGKVAHALSHRRYAFDVWTGQASSPGKASVARQRPSSATSDPMPRAWVNPDQLNAYPLPGPHVKIARMLRFGEDGKRIVYPP